MLSSPETIITSGITPMERGILKTILYFDIFNYPVTAEELFQFHPAPVDHEMQLESVLEEMVRKQFIYNHGRFYSVHESPDLVDRRIKGNKLAEVKLPVARKYSRIISYFPFVRAIMLSGSISKNYMDPDSDIDYFIVTEPGRLWLTRALLALFKRVFLLNSRKFFCINYFVDSQSLEIEEKNIYTAFETVTLIPVYGKEVYEKFIIHNSWTKNHFPNLNRRPFELIPEVPSSLRKAFEKVFSGTAGEWLDNFFMKLAITRWKKKYGSEMRGPDFEIAFKSKKNASKSHPQFFQKRILEFLEKKIQFFEDKHQLKFEA